MVLCGTVLELTRSPAHTTAKHLVDPKLEIRGCAKQVWKLCIITVVSEMLARGQYLVMLSLRIL